MIQNQQLNPTSLVDNKWKSVHITFQEIVYSVPGPNKGPQMDILKSINGDFRPGDITAIMGGSGAGKTSLMNILAGFNRSRFRGKILINDVPRNLDEFRKMSCFIMQNHELCPYLTVIEAMNFAASLKLGSELPSDVKHSLITEILKTIGISHTNKTITSKLSGGERKRLSIALEMINNPPVMFFDEPTSGLDSSNCFQVISLLRTLARGGRTIICVIHQPSSSIFALFDRVYFLTDGHCIYSGPTHSLVRYLSKSVDLVCPNDHNPADFAIEVAMGRFGNLTDQLIEANQRRVHSGDDEDDSNMIHTLNNASEINLVKTQCNIQDTTDTSIPVITGISGSPLVDSQYSNCNSAVAFNAKSANIFTQFQLIFKRSVQCILRDLILTKVRLAVQIFTALVLVVFYAGIGNEASKVPQNVGLLIINQVFIMYTAMMTTILIFPLEKSVLIREHLNNWYTLKSYFLAKSTADIPFEIGHTTVYLVIVYFATGQPLEIWRFFMYYSISLMNNFLTQSVGLAFGIIFPIEISLLVGAAWGFFGLLLSGFGSVISIVPVYLRWIFYLSNLKYAFQGSLAVIYGFGREKLNCSQPYCPFRSPDTVLEIYEVEESDFLVGLTVLFAYFIIVRLLTYYLLCRDIRSKQGSR